MSRHRRLPATFLCHASADKIRFVEPFARRLRDRGVPVWLDQWKVQPGDSLVQRVFEDGLGGAEAVIVVLSRNAASSVWMPVELDVALLRMIEDGIRVVVIRLDDAPVPVALTGKRWVNIDPDTDWSAQLDIIVRALLEPGTAVPWSRRVAPGDDQLPPATRLRRELEDPSRWLGAYEQISTVADAAVTQLAGGPPMPRGGVIRRAHVTLDWYEQVCRPLTEVLAQCGYVGDPDQPRLWARPLRRVARTALPRGGPIDETWERAAWYPVLLLASAVGVAAVAGGREKMLHPLTTEQVPTARGLRPLGRVLSPDQVVDPDLAQRLPGWTGNRHALSTHLRVTLRPAFAGILADDEYDEAYERYEYLRSLLELHQGAGHRSSLGEFAWAVHNRRSVVAERVADEVAELGERWPLLRAGAFDGSPAAVGRAQDLLADLLSERFHG